MNSEAAMRAMVQGAPQEPPMLQLGTFGDVPVQGQQVLEVPPTEVPPAPDAAAGSRTPISYGKAPQGTLTLDVPNAQRATLGNIEEKKDISAEEGRTAQTGEQQAADLMARDAAEKQQADADYKKQLAEVQAKHEANHAQLQEAYDEYKKSSGNLKDPSKEFWADKSTGARVLSGLAAFASGMGAGLLGSTGNPYLEHLDKMIASNFESHKQNINDVFQRQVQAGKISDDDDSYRQFMDQAKLHSYDLASMHIKSELERVKHTALGSNYKVLADKTINDLNQQEIDRRAALGAAQAQAAAAAAAAGRAKQKEIADKYTDAYKANLSAGYGEDQARAAAAKAVQGAGYDRSLLAPIMEANGGVYSPKSGQFEFQEAAPTEGGELVPAKDPVTGKPLKSEERRALEDQVVTDLNGTQRLARNKSEVPKITQQVQTIHGFNDSLDQLQKLQDKWVKDGALDRGDQSKWEALTGKLAVAYNGVAGSERATAEGEVENLKESVMPHPPGILGTSVKGVKITGIGAALQSKEARQAKLDALKDYVRSHSADIEGKLHPAQGGSKAAAAPAAAAYKPKSFQANAAR